MRPLVALWLTTALLSSPVLAQEAARETTAFTLSSGAPRTAEQLALRFDKADLSFRLLPETQSLEGVAVLDFTATAPFEWMPLELSEAFSVESIAMDGEDIHPYYGCYNFYGMILLYV